jgi:pseudouridine-5'-phosphate glycosidase
VKTINKIVLSENFQRARRQGKALVALESAVITHGLPHPHNLALAVDMEAEIVAAGAFPATIGLLDGRIVVGLEKDQIEVLATASDAAKVSLRDFAAVLQKGGSGGTTVAGTLLAAQLAEIQVFATGGIGGVHRRGGLDVSSDLMQLARTPIVVVCAGAKAILDLPATVEYLETLGVPVLGFGTDSFPAFYSRDSGLPVSHRADSAEEVHDFAQTHWSLGLDSAVLVVVPPPEEHALPLEVVAGAIDAALEQADSAGVRGQQVTPYLLEKVSELTGLASLAANLALLKQNARIAAEIALAIAPDKPKKFFL